MQQNPDGTWQQVIPMPYYGIRKGCSCGKKFWKEQSYEQHYIEAHTDGLLYKRDKNGMLLKGLVSHDNPQHTE